MEATELGWGGIKAVAQATGAHPDAVARGVHELDGDPQPQVRVRAPGGGRKKLSVKDPELVVALKALVDPETRGDPMSLLLWTTRSTRHLADVLTRMGHAVSDRTVARMLQEQGFSLQSNQKVLEGRQHEDRDAQFRYLAQQVAEHVGAGMPVISVDAKKKELVGAFKNGGREYQPTGQPERVNDHDFPDKDLGKAVCARMASMTSSRTRGGFLLAPTTTPLHSPFTPCADGGGSNGYRIRAWKMELHTQQARHAVTTPYYYFAIP